MQNKAEISIERIIAKIDNDFNPDNSDWIPRVGAWCIDAMSQLDVLRTSRKKKKLVVNERIANSECSLSNTNLKVYDSNGCEIEQMRTDGCYGCPSTGKRNSELASCDFTPNTVTRMDTGNEETANYVKADTVNDKYPYRYNISHYKVGSSPVKRNYVLASDTAIELNFDTDYIYVETEYIETTCSEVYGCEVPVIPNNGLLIEALTYYCMYKMLTRGNKHPVFNLSASQYGTNPYYMWNTLKDEAKRSVQAGNVSDEASSMFRSNFFINTFDSRR